MPYKMQESTNLLRFLFLIARVRLALGVAQKLLLDTYCKMQDTGIATYCMSSSITKQNHVQKRKIYIRNQNREPSS